MTGIFLKARAFWAMNGAENCLQSFRHRGRALRISVGAEQPAHAVANGYLLER